MKHIELNRIYFKDNWGFFIGSFVDNLPHSHYAIQISISLNSTISIVDKYDKVYRFENFLIKSNTTHHLNCENEHLLLLFYPTSTTGHYLQQLSENEISEFSNQLTEKLRKSGIDFISGKLDFGKTVLEISNMLETFNCECKNQNHFNDKRIKTAIDYLEKNFDRIVPIDEIASKCFLSPSRFLHLFKKETGITYRKVQQWNKVSQSFDMLFKQSLTQTAYQFGFTDSAHFTKVMKETFGFNPKTIKKC